jgi:hypothetical protein
MYRCVYVYICICACMCMYVCMYVYMLYVYVHAICIAAIHIRIHINLITDQAPYHSLKHDHVTRYNVHISLDSSHVTRYNVHISLDSSHVTRYNVHIFLDSSHVTRYNVHISLDSFEQVPHDKACMRECEDMTHTKIYISSLVRGNFNITEHASKNVPLASNHIHVFGYIYMHRIKVASLVPFGATLNIRNKCKYAPIPSVSNTYIHTCMCGRSHTRQNQHL